MRRQFIRATLTVVLMGLTTLAGVMLWVSTQGIKGEAADRLAAEAQRIGLRLEARHHQELPLTQIALEPMVPGDRFVSVELEDGRRLEAGTPVVGDELAASFVEGHVGTVTVAQEAALVRDSQLVSATVIVGVLLAVLVLSVWLARRQAARLVAPLDELVVAAERLGTGDARPTPRRYGVAELDRLADVLDGTAERVTEAVARQRALTQDVSHQLRTPLTALSIRLDEIARTTDLAVVREEAMAAQDQVERLTGMVETLLSQQSRGRDLPREIRLDSLIDQQLVEWSPIFALTDRTIDAYGDSGVQVQAPPGRLAQVLATLLENSLHHGSGVTTVRTRRTSGAVVVEVSDQGPGVPDAVTGRLFDREVSGTGGTGLGLAAARDAAQSFGGRLELVDSSTAAFALFLGDALGRRTPLSAQGFATSATLGKTQRR